jgi:hypothetical protein
MGYAYADKYGIVHIVSSPTVAKANTDGAIVETSVANANGYPQIPGVKGMEDVLAYVKEQEIYRDGNRGDGKVVTLDALPADLQEVLVKLGFVPVPVVE